MSEFTGMNKLEAMAQIAKVGYDEGVKDTEERIIKILWEWASSDDPQPRYFSAREELEAFIKGEK